jgi:hypothetical protein
MYVPMGFCTVYVRRRRVDTTVRSWSPKRVLLAALGGLPYILFILGACWAYQTVSRSLVEGMAVGAVIGAGAAAGLAVLQSRRLRRMEAGALEDEDRWRHRCIWPSRSPGRSGSRWRASGPSRIRTTPGR